jgi:pyrroline-5-carboxylate reductase
MDMNLRVGFIGGGNMAEAFIGAFINGQILLPSQVIVSDVSEERIRYLSEKFGVKVSLKNIDVVTNCDVLFLAVKPQVLPSVLREISPVVSPAQILVSMAAGFPIRKIEEFVGDDKKVVRIMPNILVKVGHGVTAYCDNLRLLDEERRTVKELLSQTGRVVDIDEKLFDAVTAVSGSSPAFFFVLIEAMCDGAVRLGLPRDKAKELVVETLIGSSIMAREGNPSLLKDSVTSPAGTTIEGIAKLEEKGFRSSLIEALKSSFERSKEISKLIEEL